MSLNFLQKSLSKLAETKASYDAYKGTGFNRYLTQTLSTVEEVAQTAIDETNTAYNQFLKGTGQPISQEIKDRQKYAKSLSEKTIQSDLSLSADVNKNLAATIERNNKEAYDLIKQSKNPFVSKNKKIKNGERLGEIKSNFQVYKEHRDIYNNLVTQAQQAQANPDPFPTLLESKVASDLLDGSFPDKVTWDPVIDGEQKIGGYYNDEGKLIAIPELMTTSKVDLEYETELAEAIANASKLARQGKWNDATRRQTFSEIAAITKKDYSSLRPIIFGGFSAARTTGEDVSFAGNYLLNMINNNPEYAKVKNMPEGVEKNELLDAMLDTLKTENLSDAFTNYLFDMADSSAQTVIKAKEVDKNDKDKTGGLTDVQKQKLNTFVRDFNEGEDVIQFPFNTKLSARPLPDGTFEILENDNPLTLSNQSRLIVDKEQLIERVSQSSSTGLPNAYLKMLKDVKIKTYPNVNTDFAK
tara:strand:+ start:10884 stop:12293 length:1410 start_codon:yes stop_codon:yes gene_type:complete